MVFSMMLVHLLGYSLSAGLPVHSSTHSSIPITKSTTILFTDRFISLSLPSYLPTRPSPLNISTQLPTQPFATNSSVRPLTQLSPIHPFTYLHATHSPPSHPSTYPHVHHLSHPSTPRPMSVFISHPVLCTSSQIFISPPVSPLISPLFVPFPSFLLSRDLITFSLSKHLLRAWAEIRGQREIWVPDIKSRIGLGRWVWSNRHRQRPRLFSVIREKVPQGP